MRFTAGKHSVCTTPRLYDFVPCLSLGSAFCYWSCVQRYPRLLGHKVGYSSMFFDEMKTEKSILSKKKKKARLTENKPTVSSLMFFQCLLQATDDGFSIS